LIATPSFITVHDKKWDQTLTFNKLFKGPLAWGILVFFWVIIGGVLVWDLSSGQTEQRIRGEQSTQNHIEYAEDRISSKCFDLKGVALRNCIYEEIESALDHGRANQSLNAQQETVFFTKMMGYTAVVGLLLGGASFFGVLYTLNQMRLTNQIMRQEQRPWLSFEITQFGKFQAVGWENGEKSIVFFPRVEIENFGKAPALDIRFDVWIWEGKSFDDDIAQKEMSSQMVTSPSQQGPIAFPEKEIVWENWGAGHRVRKLETTREDNGTNNFWLVATLAYRFGDQWFFTSQMFSCEAFEVPVGNNWHTLEPKRWPWTDTYT